MSQVDLSPPSPEPVDHPHLNVKRRLFWSTDIESQVPEFAKKYGLDITELLLISDNGQPLLLPVYFNTADKVTRLSNPSWEVDGQSVSILSYYRKIFDADKNGEQLNQDTLLKFQVGVLELNLPIIAAAYLAGKPNITLEKMRELYCPGTENSRPIIAKLSGLSRAGKSQFLAIEAFRGNIAVVASEPFSDYGFNNYLSVLREFAEANKDNSEIDVAKFTDDQLLEVIKIGMEKKEKSGTFPAQQTSVGAMIEEILKYCETGRERPEIIYFDLNGYTQEKTREPHEYDLITMYAPDVLLLSRRGFEISTQDNQWKEVSEDKRAVNVNDEVIEDYRQQLNDPLFQAQLRTTAAKATDAFVRRLEM